MKILILGASSYVGARLYFDLQKDFDVVGTYSSNKLSQKLVHLDITNKEEVNSLIDKVKPKIIVHVANNANARWCEANPAEAKLLNETSASYIVEAADKIGAKIIYISSFAAINPSNVYSKTKFASEEKVKQTKAGWIILRPSFILGFSPNTTNDRPFNRLLNNLDKGTRAEYDTSWKFQTTWVGHISQVIKIVIQNNIDKEFIPIVSNELKSRYDTAKDILSLFGVPVYPVDKKDKLPVVKDDLSKLKELNLPIYSYKQIIDFIVEEIKQRKTFII
jgi:dTDP-4-dehydrorhamnose reductase